MIIGAGLVWATATTLTAANKTTAAPRDTAANEPGFLTFELDRLFRAERRPESADEDARAEAGRIIQTGWDDARSRRTIAPIWCGSSQLAQVCLRRTPTGGFCRSFPNCVTLRPKLATAPSFLVSRSPPRSPPLLLLCGAPP